VAVSRRARRSRFTLALLLLTSATLITLDLRGFQPLDQARSGALDALAPVRDGARNAFEPIGNAWNGALNYDDLASENEALREQIAEMEGELARGDDATSTLERLTAELELEYVGDIDRTVARVVSGPVSNFEHRIEIDKGRDHGIREDMPVVNSAGLVGRVQTVSNRRAIVQLVTEPGFFVGVRLSELDEVGVARGQGRRQPLLVFTGIDADLDVPVGALVTTSGLAGTRFPADIPVGHVRASIAAEGELAQDLLLDTLADLESLSFVNVMQWEPEP
jgi:rod shape-determining protein MreC